MSILEKLFGSHSDREVKRILPIVDRIEALGDEYAALSDEELRAKTGEFKARYANGEDLDALLEQFLDEDDQEFADHPRGYQNFANGYTAYNTDDTDEDLEVYSDEVLEEPEPMALPVRIVLAAALAGAALSLVYIAARCFL